MSFKGWDMVVWLSLENSICHKNQLVQKEIKKENNRSCKKKKELSGQRGILRNWSMSKWKIMNEKWCLHHRKLEYIRIHSFNKQGKLLSWESFTTEVRSKHLLYISSGTLK